MSRSSENIASFHIESWHSLLDAPAPPPTARAKEAPSAEASGADTTHDCPPALLGVSPDLTKLLYDTLAYPYDGIRNRIKRLNVSARAFEEAKREGCEKGFIIESAAGAITCLIPLAKTFEAFGFPYPYRRDVSHEHSYFVAWGQHLLQADPANKKVYTELKVGESSCTSDIVTIGHDGTRRTYEVTLSTTNILANAAKYARTDFAQVIFLCRDYRLREAVRACCREGGLDADLLAKLEFMQFSTLANRQRRLSL